MHSLEDGKVLCQECFGGTLSRARASILMQDKKPLLCKECGEAAAKKARKSWTVLTPHKQGAMFFTAETAREVAIGINNKGGLVK
jgi:hypothetical protein